MKVSLNWIKDYVDLPQDMDLTRLAYDLTMSTVEVEGAEDLARRFDHMLVGRIVEVCPHPNADKLQICRTDIGGGDIRDIVCGGTNVRPGMKVAVAAPGAMCRWHGEGEPVEIKEAKLRGVKSYGMICGAAEIGLGDLFPTTEEAHILDLSDFDAAAGTPIADALDLHDIILEIDNKSMTNRPDLWGHYGIARELAALYDLPLKPMPPFTYDAGADGLTVTVEDTERCPRYIGAAVEGLSVKPAPFRMQSRIWRVGMRPINALVDITNYVMLATPPTPSTPTTSPGTSSSAGPRTASSWSCSTARPCPCPPTIWSSPTRRGWWVWPASWAAPRTPFCPPPTRSSWRSPISRPPASAARPCGTTTAPRRPPAMKRASTRSAATRPCPWP